MLIKLNQRKVFTFYFSLFLPFLYLSHAFLYYLTGTSSATIVYLIKISYLGILIDAIKRWGIKPFSSTNTKIIILIFAITSTFSIISNLIYINHTDIFYFITDLIGWLIIPFYVSIILHFLRKNKYYLIEKNNLNSIIQLNLINMSLVIIFYYYLSNGMKVSTPPDTQFVLVFTISTFITEQKKTSLAYNLIVTIIVTIAVFVSQLRMLAIVFIGTLLISLLWSFFYQRRYIKIIKYFIATTIIIGLVFFMFQEVFLERLNTLPIIGNSQNLVEDGIGDESINQRSVEASQVFAQMYNAPLSYITGMGFGASYKNTLITNDHYSLDQHHLHSTPVAIWFRNGLISAFFYMLIPLIAIRYLFTNNRLLFSASLALLMQWISSLVDLYIYWGFNYAFAIALWLFAKLDNKSKE